MDALMTPEFWIAVGQIIMIDILLGGDNAVVIALACRKLPPAQRTKGILWGTAGAIVLRVILIFFALQLLAIPFLKLVGAILLVWIGVKLLVPESEDEHAKIEGSDKLWGAVKTVIVADLVMSVDNVIAIAGAAETAGGDHTMPLVIFGLLVSIPDHRLGQSAGDQADGPLPDHHHPRGDAAGLDRRHDGGRRPRTGQSRTSSSRSRRSRFQTPSSTVQASLEPCWCWRWARRSRRVTSRARPRADGPSASIGSDMTPQAGRQTSRWD